MKKILLISLIHLCLSSQGNQPPPNFLFIFADDMAFETIAAYSQTDIDTPHLNRLVQRGTHFSHAYNMGAWNGAVCIASRTMLLSGKTVWNAHKLDSKKKDGGLSKERPDMATVAQTSRVSDLHERKMAHQKQSA